MRVCVLGGSGFLGTTLVNILSSYLSQIDNSSEIIVIDSNPETKYVKQYSNVQVNKYVLDLSCVDVNLLSVILAGSKAVFNLAAIVGGIGNFHKYPADILDNNCKIVINALNAIRQLGKKVYPRFVFISSSVVYENATKFPTKEEDLDTCIKPSSAYAISKLFGEEACKAYYDQYGIPWTVIRPFNAIGPDELPHDTPGIAHVIPDIIKKILEGQGDEDNPLEIFGDGKQVRHFTHVEDICRAIVLSAFNEKAINQDFNISDNQGYKIMDVVKIIWKHIRNIPSTRLVVKHLTPFKYDTRHREPDTTKARELLGWTPRFTLDDSIDEIIKSVRQHVKS